MENSGAGGLDFFDSIDRSNPLNIRTERALVRQSTFQENGPEYQGAQELPNAVAMREHIAKAKSDIKRALKNTSMVLQDLQDNQSSRAHLVLKPNCPVSFPIKQYIKQFMVVDIFMRSQPAIIRVNGCRGEMAVYVSSNNQFPDEDNNQTCFRN